MVMRKVQKTLLHPRNIFFRQQAQELLNSFLLEELPVSSANEFSDQYKRHLDIHFRLFKIRYERPLIFEQRIRHKALKYVMLEMSLILVGETRHRLSYAFEKLGFIKEELHDLKHKNWWIRANACRNLSLMQARNAAGNLVPLLDDTSDDVRIEAAQAMLDIVGVDALSPILMTFKDVTPWMQIRLSRSILPMSAKAVPHLILGLKSEYAHVQKFCIEILGIIGDVSAAPIILEYIGYAIPEVQEISLIVLGKLGDEQSVPVILKYLRSENIQLQKAAAKAAGYLATPASIKPLNNLLLYGQIELRFAAAEALSKIGDDGMQCLVTAAESQDHELRNIASQYLHESGYSSLTTV
jgi:HEAT repeat protein